MTKKKRILVVEDDWAFQMMLNLLLKRAGYDVEIADNGRDGLNKARSWHPNLVIADWMMPVMTGPQMVKQMRVEEDLKHVYVIMLTAKASTQDVVAGLDDGADDYLVKPTGNAELLARVRAGMRVQELQESLTEQYQAVAEEQARLETVLSSVAEAIIVLDEKGRVQSLNQMAKTLMGRPGKVLVGNYIDDLSNGSMSDLLHSAQVSGDKAAVAEITLQDNKIYTARCTPVATDQGKGWVATLQDITHLKELDRLKTQALQHVAHDIKSPLTRVRGFVEALEYLGPLTEAQVDAQASALLGTDLIRDLVRGLLDLEKIEAGITDRQPFDLAEMAYDTVDEYRWNAQSKGVNLVVQENGRLPSLVGDRLQLCQALRNLVDNAVKYTPVGGTVTVSVSQEGTEARLSVTDTGAGIPANLLPHLFDRFFRAPGQTKDSGSGLGLAIVKSTVDAHGGRVWAESSQGRGATFYITLPMPTRLDSLAVDAPLPVRRPSRHRMGRPALRTRTMASATP